MNVTVAAIWNEAIGIIGLELVSADGTPLPPFSAGSHIDVAIAPGITRQYSLCNDPSESHRYRLGVLLDPNTRGGSAGMHRLKVGDSLSISAPRNHFPLVPAARSILLAGGIGVTPILCMAERLAKTGSHFEMHYFARSPERMAFKDSIASAGFRESVFFHYDDNQAQTLDLAALLDNPQEQTHLYVCGPRGFIEYAIGTARAQRWENEQVHTEYFGGVAADPASEGAFEVQIASSGAVIAIPAGRSTTQVLAENGFFVPVSCEQGVCGTCITRVLDGEIDHRDAYFTDEEKARNDQFTPCCSRARSKRLVLDL
ncbi:MAG: vanB [Massilia sp.]|jgi:vanillate O-demethylase ferredoxin subunit|nr:vanB [Massilia sp.]MDB5948987.1 vanB [Massilia sp.]